MRRNSRLISDDYPLAILPPIFAPLSLAAGRRLNGACSRLIQPAKILPWEQVAGAGSWKPFSLKRRFIPPTNGFLC